MDHKLLSIYLNDHLAGATAGRELARRAAGSNPEGDLGDFLARLAEEVEEDRQALISLMARLEVPEDRVKQVAGWSAEKAGRLKLNGRLIGYSPLSRVTELEALLLGITGKLALWRALERLAAAEPRIAQAIELPVYIARAEAQLAGLEAHRLDAVRAAIAQVQA